jgi:hypothetical protein
VKAAHYQIPQSKIKNKLKGNFNRKPGRPTVYSFEEKKNVNAEQYETGRILFPHN